MGLNRCKSACTDSAQLTQTHAHLGQQICCCAIATCRNGAGAFMMAHATATRWRMPRRLEHMNSAPRAAARPAQHTPSTAHLHRNKHACASRTCTTCAAAVAQHNLDEVTTARARTHARTHAAPLRRPTMPPHHARTHARTNWSLVRAHTRATSACAAHTMPHGVTYPLCIGSSRIHHQHQSPRRSPGHGGRVRRRVHQHAAMQCAATITPNDACTGNNGHAHRRTCNNTRWS